MSYWERVKREIWLVSLLLFVCLIDLRSHQLRISCIPRRNRAFQYFDWWFLSSYVFFNAFSFILIVTYNSILWLQHNSFNQSIFSLKFVLVLISCLTHKITMNIAYRLLYLFLFEKSKSLPTCFLNLRIKIMTLYVSIGLCVYKFTTAFSSCM